MDSAPLIVNGGVHLPALTALMAQWHPSEAGRRLRAELTMEIIQGNLTPDEAHIIMDVAAWVENQREAA